ncbi:hypothetical protein O181_093704 [Austropuccinia psidii MF-1]|uniref:Uncharacterized protein n=1 Tax=Austropuccinia psidii MF-1 TaxID=1389203 RepID=A0A9Q3J1Z4_9BASI|nr:hypothetical protein [Austropuccinia psidii MF-1]
MLTDWERSHISAQFCACRLSLGSKADDLGNFSHDAREANGIEKSTVGRKRPKALPIIDHSASNTQHGTNEGITESIGRRLPNVKPISEQSKPLETGRFEEEFNKLENVKDKVNKLQKIFKKLNFPTMKYSRQEKWAKTFAKIMDDQANELKERELEVEMQVQLLDLEIYAKRISATTSQSLEGETEFTRLQKSLATRLRRKEYTIEFEPFLENRLDNVLLITIGRMEKILDNQAAKLFGNDPLLKDHFSKLSSADCTDKDFKTTWHEVANSGKSSNTATLTRQKVAAVSLLCYVFEVATRADPQAPQAKRAVAEMRAIVKDNDFEKNFMGPLKKRLSWELAYYDTTWKPHSFVKFVCRRFGINC